MTTNRTKPETAQKQAAQRLISIDVLRGFIMVLMTLDHTRDFFSNAHFDPTDLGKTTPALFLTRWVTHFCAPVFIFLAGVAAFLSTQQGLQQQQLRRYLILRGTWIIALGLSLETLIWTARPGMTLLTGAVLWAIGWSMLFLAPLVGYRPGTIAVIGLVMMTVHNAFDGIEASALGPFGPLWSILHTGEMIRLGPAIQFEPYYPLIPWLGVMAAGYGCGPLFVCEPARRTRLLFKLGWLSVLLFVILRWTNLYGDPGPWSVQASWVMTVLAFLNCDKYPPSLLYLLMTIGPALLVLARLENATGRSAHFFMVFGRVPLFYYLIHLPYIVLLALLLAGWQQGSFPNFLHAPFTVKTYGYGLPIVFLIWLGVVVTLYPFCRRFGAFKQQHPRWQWLRFL